LELEFAKKAAADLMAELAPCSTSIEVVGSIRRQCPEVKDIDLVLIPKNQGLLDTKLREMGCQFGGPKIRRLVYKGAVVDIYIATPETWATILLIRTGSTRHNVWMCARAKAQGLQLKADGQGLMDYSVPFSPRRVAGDSEEDIFKALGIPYREPWERE
jgi:DNA polymerase (family 10)